MRWADPSDRGRPVLADVPRPDPAPRDPAARARRRVPYGQVCFDAKVDDTGTPNRGHHEELESRGKIADCVAGDQAVLADIVANPDQYDVNFHNARFPGGAIRCQLED